MTYFFLILFSISLNSFAQDLSLELNEEISSLTSSFKFNQDVVTKREADVEQYKSYFTNRQMNADERSFLETKIAISEQAKKNLQKVQYLLDTKIKIVEKYLQSTEDISCTSKLNTIDLEQPELALFGHQMELQGQFGTCFANATKNILLSLTRGKKDVSFLDLAIQSKEEDSLVNSGLDAGGICQTLDKVRESGLCLQKKALIETSHQAVSSTLMHEIREMRKLKSLLKFYPQTNLSTSFLNKFNSRLIFPYNESVWKKWFEESSDTKQSYYFFYDQFLMDEWKLRIKFISNIIENKSGINDQNFCSEYFATISPLLKKYSINTDNFKRIACRTPLNVSYLSELTISLKEIGDVPKLMLMHQLAEVLQRRPELELEDLVAKVFSMDAHSLVLLVVAPECATPKGRTPFNEKYYCEDNYIKKNSSIMDAKTLKIKLRQRILLHLSQGYALGNMTFGHVNTIVGYRWSPLSNSCEFKIRESQTASSVWTSENKILQNMQGLVEVR